MTYNQSNYILDALNGFVMQKTNFPFVCLVMDDASTDGEQEVIKGFLDKECAMESAEFSEIEEANIVVVPHKTNPNCTMAVYFLKKNLYGTDKKTPLIAPWREKCKYEAICEGDDYWIDSLKLYKQVEYLETHLNISLSCCRYQIWGNGVNRLAQNSYFDQLYKGEDSFVFSRDDAYHGEWLTQPLTCVFRTDANNSEFVHQFKHGRDVHMYYNILSHGDGVCHAFVGGVYRMNENGIFSGKTEIERLKINYEVYSEFCSKTKDPYLEMRARDFCMELLKSHQWPIINSRISLECYFVFLSTKTRMKVKSIIKKVMAQFKKRVW